ncbi:uncharacterized protein [Physcomitrium patens]|uniref:Serine-threonine kinase receptor-associated protein n=1 Tax=Physcomitrium patens TaxID=3218 RepID=A9RS01_PHYPA|nr:serine-threonine kinase receptor-associated protein-like [Physcomitrium patens]PNR57391.1 hypothetical protein PHYPA_004385 [Physcomitrium patens]|eukprot:XP_024371090.1 serine-threonine kinase receptor-associated protein-like [Physcomitrella patens]
MEKRKAQVPLVCHGHSRPIVDLSYSPITPDGFFLVSASKDGKPMLRNGETGDWIGTFDGHKGAVWAACLDTPAMRCATASADFSARVWDALTGDELYSFEHKHIVRTCAFSESTTHLLTGGAEKVLRIFDLARPDAPPTLLESKPETPIRAAVWHHSDQTILSSSNDIGGVRVWDVRTKSVVRTLDTKSSCTSVEVSRDGRYITTADGNTVKFWDANHFGLVKSYSMPRPVESASLFPSRGKFIAGGDDMWVRLFDFDTGDEIECNKGHHGPVHCVRFSPGGESYASGSEDGTIRIWKTVNGNDEAEVGGVAEGAAANQIKVRVNEVARKVQGFHIAQEDGAHS